MKVEDGEKEEGMFNNECRPGKLGSSPVPEEEVGTGLLLVELRRLRAGIDTHVSTQLSPSVPQHIRVSQNPGIVLRCLMVSLHPTFGNI